jgi:hypothetical protein
MSKAESLRRTLRHTNGGAEACGPRQGCKLVKFMEGEGRFAFGQSAVLACRFSVCSVAACSIALV